MTSLFETNWVQRAAMYVIFGGSLAIIYIAFLLLYPVEPITVVQPHHVLTPVINQGDRLIYEVAYCLEDDEQFTVERTLMNVNNSELWDIPDRINNLPAGCTKETHDVLTPMRLEPGEYKMLTRIILKVNQIRYIPYNFETEVFKVNQPTI